MKRAIGSPARMMIAESSLSFLGIGIPPNIPRWGSMVADGRSFLGPAWWISVFPGLALTTTVLAVYFCGDGLRDLLDPRLRLSGSVMNCLALTPVERRR